MPKETNSRIVTTLNTVSDYVRVIKDDISSRISVTNLVAVMNDSLIALINKEKIREVSTSTSILSDDNTLLVDSSGGNRSYTLPDPATVWDATNSQSNVIRVVQKISGGNSVTVNPFGGEAIYVGGIADSTVVLTGGSAATFVSNGMDYIVVGS